MTKYQEEADMCQFLIDAFLGNLMLNERPEITISDDAKHICVTWHKFRGMSYEERAEMILEAYSQAFPDGKLVLKILSCEGKVK